MPISSPISNTPCASCAAEAAAPASLALRLARIVGLPAIALVRLYQLTLSSWLGHGCRFQPTCSAYMIEALRQHGLPRGLGLGIGRLARCHPWGGGGFDPVPSLGHPHSHIHPHPHP